MTPAGWSPQEIATTVAWMAQTHADELRRHRRPVPDWLPALAGLFTDWATGGAGRDALELVMRPAPRLLTYAQVGHLLAGRHPRTVARLVESGELRAVKVRGTPLVRVEDLDDYLDRLVSATDDDTERQSPTTSPDPLQDGHGDLDEPNEERDHAA